MNLLGNILHRHRQNWGKKTFLNYSQNILKQSQKNLLKYFKIITEYSLNSVKYSLKKNLKNSFCSKNIEEILKKNKQTKKTLKNNLKSSIQIYFT